MRVVKKDYLFDLEVRIDYEISGMDPNDRPVRLRSLYQEPTDQDARDAEIVKLLTEIFVHVRGWRAYGNGSSLARIRRDSDGRQSGIVKLRALAWVSMPEGRVIVPWRDLARLVRPHTLLQFLQDHPDAFVLGRKRYFGGFERLHCFACSDVDGPGQPVAPAPQLLTGWENLPTVATLISELGEFQRQPVASAQPWSLLGEFQRQPVAPAQPWSFDDIDFGADQSFDDIARFLAHLSIQGYDEID